MVPKPNNVDDAAKYGYEDADVVAAAAAAAATAAAASAATTYGYEDPDSISMAKYGYEDPDVGSRSSAGGFIQIRQPRRSSMKQEGVSRERRRASIQTVGTFEVHLPGRSEPVMRRTSIDFMEACTVGETTTVDEKEMSERWMSTEEYDRIDKDNGKIVKAIEKGTDKNFCTRGLENRLESDAERVRKESQQVVWEEQFHQKQEGKFDEMTISEKYHLASIQAKLTAVERAEQDNADIESYLKSTRKMLRRMSC